jgi:outer membrane biosynthesis protein TonB
MDGVLLVFDSRTLPNLHALATVPPVPKSQRRNRAVPAFATLTLALVLGTVYYVTTQRRTPLPPPVAPSILSTAPVTIPTPEPTPEAVQPKEEEAKPVAVKQPATAPVKTSSKKPPSVSETKRAEEPKKEEPKVNSILKKTGRFLSKPFKKL